MTPRPRRILHPAKRAGADGRAWPRRRNITDPDVNTDDHPLLLIVDDDPDQLFLIRAAAIKAGDFQILTAQSAEAALALLQARDVEPSTLPDLIVSDLKMPKTDGIAFLGALKRRRHFRHVPMVIISSSNFAPDRQNAVDAGIDDFIRKPMQFDRLVEWMRTLPKYLPASPRQAAQAKPSAIPR
jgi:CheY-like chemotaxis protein